MGIINIPSDKRRPGTFLTFDDISGARGLQPIPGRAVALVGAKSAAGSLTLATPTLVSDESEADDGAGESTLLALAARAVFAMFRMHGIAAPVYLCACADPAGVASAYTATVSGTATEAGDLVIEVNGEVIRVPVNSGDSAATVAAALDGKLAEAAKLLPVTSAVAAAVVTMTFAVTGADGQGMQTKLTKAPAGISVAFANSVTGTGAVSYTDALAALLSKDLWSISIQSSDSTSIDALQAHVDAAWSASKKKIRRAFVGASDTVANLTTLATGANQKQVHVLGIEGSKWMPAQLGGVLAAMPLTKAKINYNFDGYRTPIPAPEPADVFTDAEVETCLAGGVTPATVNEAGEVIIERFVSTKTTEGGVPFENLLDSNNGWVPAVVGKQVDQQVALAMRGKNLDSELLETVGDIVFDILKRYEAAGEIHNVDAHKDEISVEVHPDVPTRLLITVPVSVTPNAHQADTTIRLYVEAAS